MKRTAFLGIITICFAAVILVFSSVGPAQQAASKSKDFQWPPVLKVVTAGTQSAGFASTNGWAPKLQAAIGAHMRVVPEDSLVRRYVRLTENKEFELASLPISDMALAFQGEEGFADKRVYPVTIVWHHNDSPWSFAVRGDSKLKTIYDMKQKGIRVALSTQSAAMTIAMQEALPAFLGWTQEEAKRNWIYVPVGSYAENCRSVTEGKTDVAYVSPMSSVTYEMEAHPKKIRWLSMPLTDKEAWKRWLKIRPTSIPTTLDWGVPSALGVDALSSNYLYWSRPDLSQEMFYRLAKWFNESFESYKTVHATVGRMSLQQFRNYLNYSPFPISEGTVKYLKEIGQWKAADDKWNGEANKLMNQWVKARNAALDDAKAKGVKVDWKSKEYLNLLNKYTAGIPPFTARVQ
jgi:TRAP transporter TAXI family solute receptor